jgi:hypothetical protein
VKSTATSFPCLRSLPRRCPCSKWFIHGACLNAHVHMCPTSDRRPQKLPVVLRLLRPKQLLHSPDVSDMWGCGPHHLVARAEKRVGHIGVCGGCLALCLHNLSRFICMPLSNNDLCFAADSLAACLNCYCVAMRGHRVLILSCIHANLCLITHIATL